MAPEAIIAVLGGTIGTLGGVIIYLWKLHQAEDARREADHAKREDQLERESAAWQGRWEALDGRLDRVTRAWTKALGTEAPE